MTSQSKKNKSNRLPQRVFAPPVVKSYSTPFGKGELERHGKAEDGVTAKSINILPAQSKRQNERTFNVGKKSQCKEDLEMIENEKGCLTDAQFEEIVQSVLQKSPQECTEKFRKRLVSAESAEGQRSRRETPEAFLPAERNGSRKETGGRPSEVGRKEQQGKMRKQSRLGVSRGEKKPNEKAAANNVGCKANRKREPKKAAQGGDAQDVMDPEEAPEEEEEEEEAAGGSGSGRELNSASLAGGLFGEDGQRGAEQMPPAASGSQAGPLYRLAQCSYPSCEKWRRLGSHVDPSALPEDWSCSQNPDLQYNSCSVPEEDWSGSENEVVYAIYFLGSIVWAKQYGYPWWPGIIEADPDIEEYFLFSSQADSLPSKYHVTFFGHSVTRAWISASQLKNYGEALGEGSTLAKLRSKSEKKDLKAALEMAKEAEQISIQKSLVGYKADSLARQAANILNRKERIRRFGFHSRFKNKASPKDDKILKEQNNSASRPPLKGAPETKGGNKNTAASSKNPGKLLHEISAVKPNANVKNTVDMKGDKKTKLGPESAPPVSKKSRRERTAPQVAATPRGSDQATGKERSSQKGPGASGQAPLFLQRQQQPSRLRRLSLAQPERRPEQV